MLRNLYITILLGTAQVGAMAQHADLIVFSENGEKFTLTIDGMNYNTLAAARVEAREIRNETPKLNLTFQDPALGSINKGGYFPLGKEYTIMVKKNKKGAFVLRPMGEAELNATHRSADTPEWVNEGDAETLEHVEAEDQVVQTVEMTEQTVGSEVIGNDGVNMTIDVNEAGMNMNMQVSEDDIQTGSSTTTTTTTTTTTIIGGQAVVGTEPDPVEQPVIGDVGCQPMSTSAFDAAEASIEGKSFEESKLTLAKQIARNNCMSAMQVKNIMDMFSFEDSKLDFAKFAYDHTLDVGNYFQVNDAFDFESSIEELNQYLEGR